MANIGDSRAVLSANAGQSMIQISQDHTPASSREANRIWLAGGSIVKQVVPNSAFTTPCSSILETAMPSIELTSLDEVSDRNHQLVVQPANLRVTRCLGVLNTLPEN